MPRVNRKGPTVDPELAAIIGSNFRRGRKARGESQAECAIRTGLSQKQISAIERGQSNPTMQNLKLMADAMGMTLVEFIQPPHQDDTADS